MADLKVTVAERLQNLMVKYSLSQTEFANKVGISKDIVSKLVNGKYSLSISNAIRIAEAFNVSLDYLLGRSEKENPSQYALEILLKHFHDYKETSYWHNSLIEAHISVSPALAELLNKFTGLDDARIDIDDDLREISKQRAKEKFLSVIEDDFKDSKRYVLLDANFYTTEVRTAVENVKENMRGELH